LEGIFETKKTEWKKIEHKKKNRFSFKVVTNQTPTQAIFGSMTVFNVLDGT